MKTISIIIISTIVSVLCFAQTTTQKPNLKATGNTTTATNSKTSKKAEKKFEPLPLPTPAPTPIPPPESPWTRELVLSGDFFQNSATSTQWDDLKLGYNFSEQVSMLLEWGYSGLLQPKNSSDAQIWDPEISLGFDIPLSPKQNKSQWNFQAGTSLVLPASPDSVKNSLIAGFSVNLGFQWKRGPWTVINSNNAYVYSFQYQPTTFPDNPISDSVSAPVPIQPSNSLTYVSTSQLFRVAYAFTPKISGKIDTWYNMDFNGNVLPNELVKLSSTVGYAVTPGFSVFTGLATSTRVDQNVTPGLLSYDSTAFRLGVDIKF